MAKDVIILNYERDGGKIYFDFTTLSGYPILKGKTSESRFILIKQKVQKDYPFYPLHETEGKVVKEELKASLDLKLDKHKKSMVLPREEKIVRYKFTL